MNIKNMKIEINEQQTLPQVVKELERLGCSYSGDGFDKRDFYVCVARTLAGWQWATTSWRHLFDFFDGQLTTLTEIKQMRV